MEVDGHPVIFDPAQIAEVMEHEDVIGYDSETTGFSPWRSNIALMQFHGEKSGVVGLCRVMDGNIPAPIRDVFKGQKTFIVHNGVGFDIPFLASHGIDYSEVRWFDTLVGETVVVGSNRRDISVSLRNTAKRRLGKTIDKSQQKSSWANPTLTQEQIEYAARDVIPLPDIMHTHIDKAEETGQADALAMEMDLVPVFAQMTINGIPLNPKIAREYSEEQRKMAQEKSSELFSIFGNLNLNSPIQVRKAFASKGIPLLSTSSEVITDLSLMGGDAGYYAQLLLDYRFGNKRANMFSDEWIAEHVTNGIVHPKFWQCSTDTGRTTSSDPNIQQIPKDGRWIFGNVPGHKMVSCDYSQIELRVVAHLAHDENLLRALEAEDVHRYNASQSLGIPYDEVTDEQRRDAKAISFLLVFGGGAAKLFDYARRQGSHITIEQAQEMYDGFFANYSGIQKLIANAQRLADSPRPVVTIRLPNGLRRNLVGQSKRATVIVNTAVQGTAAVGLKYGLQEMHRRGLTKYLSAVVHDEAVACVPDNEVEEYKKELEDCMVTGMRRILPNVRAETKVGDGWQK